MKKLFAGKKAFGKRLAEFVDRKGFYVVLVLCIAIVGVAAAVVTTYNLRSPKIDFDADYDIADNELDYDQEGEGYESSAFWEDTGEEESMAAVTESDEKSEAGEDMAKESGSGVAGASTSSDSASADPGQPANTGEVAAKDDKTAAGENENVNFIMPVIGDVTQEYAMDRLVYSKTLEDWRTHSGIDIAAPISTVVKAVADGVVTEIKKDPGFGITVVIDHQNGYKTVYSNLADTNTVVPNQRVKQGEPIGSVGDTAAFEAAEATHLHFEVLKDNKHINPMDILELKK